MGHMQFPAAGTRLWMRRMTAMSAFKTRLVTWLAILAAGILPASYVSCDPMYGFQFERIDSRVLEEIYEDDYYYYEDIYYEPCCYDFWW
jgi:hypothetical protein